MANIGKAERRGNRIAGPVAGPRPRRSRLLLGASAIAALGLVWAVEPLSAGGQAPAAEARTDAPDTFALAAAALGPAPATSRDQRGTIEMVVDVPADGDIAALLERAGAGRRDAAQAAGAIGWRIQGIGTGSELAILFGEQGSAGRAIERIELRDDWGRGVSLARTAAGRFASVTPSLAVQAKMRRVRGPAGEGLYWSLRAAGVPGQAAQEYMEAVLVDAPGERVSGSDRFDLVLSGERLVYAALERNRGASVKLVKWPVGEGTQWLRPDARPARAGAGLLRPVSGPVTSMFGYREHPILGFGRMHRGVDFQAAWGTPVLAAADGLVSAAGWNGGYGRQVRITHSGGLQTSYSHLSSILAGAGGRVRQGQVIGYVGSSGLSTGAHLHYEVLTGGRAVDPLDAPRAASRRPDAEDMARMREWLARLYAVEPSPSA